MSDRCRCMVKRKKCRKKEVWDYVQALLDLPASDSTVLIMNKDMGSILNESVTEENVELVQQVHALQQQVLQSPTFHAYSLYAESHWNQGCHNSILATKLWSIWSIVSLFWIQSYRARMWQGRWTKDDNDMKTEGKANLSPRKSCFGCYNALMVRVAVTRHCRQI